MRRDEPTTSNAPGTVASSWRADALRTEMLHDGVVLLALAPGAWLATRHPGSLAVVAMALTQVGCARLFARRSRWARPVLVGSTVARPALLVAVFGAASLAHVLWLGIVPLYFLAFDATEARRRNAVTAVVIALCVCVQAAHSVGLAPAGVPSGGGIAVAVLALALYLMVRRTRLLAQHLEHARGRVAEVYGRFEEAQATAHIGSFDTDLVEQRTLWSRELFLIHGLDPAAGVPPAEKRLALVHPDDRQAVQRRLQVAIESEGEHVVEYRIMRADGEERTLRWSARCVMGPGRRAVRLLGCVQDVTERTRHEEALVRAREAAEAASRAKSMFLANMSHELRTPMNGVLGMTALALETELTAEQREYLEAAHGSGAALLAILNDILDLSKIEAGKLSIEAVSFSVRTVVQQATQLLEPRALQKGLDFVVEVDESVAPRHVGDPVRIRQLLVNLLGNAVKFTERGGVRLSVYPHARGDDQLVVEVADTGIGIPEARQRLIFDAFTQADGSTTRRFGGTGLGLTICRELVRLMRGSIEVQSREGEGSLFRITLTLPAVSQLVTDHGVVGVRKISPPRANRPVRALSVLLAEDNATNARLASRLVERFGHRVTHVVDGREALEALARERFDLVLMDIQMPDIDGLEVTARWRAHEASTGQHVPILAMTANAMKGDEEACLAAGMDGYLSKPLQFSKVQEALLRYAVEPLPATG